LKRSQSFVSKKTFLYDIRDNFVSLRLKILFFS
jgi:hypothetical protein